MADLNSRGEPDRSAAGPGVGRPQRDLALAMVCNRGTGPPIGDLRLAALGATLARAPGLRPPR